MISSKVSQQPGGSGRLCFFVAVRSVDAEAEGTSSICLAFNSSSASANNSHTGWAESALPFCFPLGANETGNRKREPFHFMLSDGTKTHGFCRRISSVRSSRS